MKETKINIEELSLKDIGKPILYKNRGEEEIGVLAKFNKNASTLHIHFAPNLKAIMLHSKNCFKLEIV